jgi:hypothetical protein
VKKFRVLLSDRNSIVIYADLYEEYPTKLVFKSSNGHGLFIKKVATFFTSNILGFEELGEESSDD